MHANWNEVTPENVGAVIGLFSSSFSHTFRVDTVVSLQRKQNVAEKQNFSKWSCWSRDTPNELDEM